MLKIRGLNNKTQNKLYNLLAVIPCIFLCISCYEKSLDVNIDELVIFPSVSSSSITSDKLKITNNYIELSPINKQSSDFDYGDYFGTKKSSEGKLVASNYTIDNNLFNPSNRPFDNIYEIEYSSDNNIMWISVPDSSNTPKVYVYDTKGTHDLEDDDLLGVYDTSMFSSLSVLNTINWLDYDSTEGIIYISTLGTYQSGSYVNNGIAAIDTKKTKTLSDDTLLGIYNSTSFSSIPNWNVYDVEISNDLDAIFISVLFYGHPYDDAGVYVINRQGTKSIGDDTLEAHYGRSTAVPAKGHNFWKSQYDHNTGLLFISATSAGQVTIIDTKKTIDPSDDIVHSKFNNTTTPSIEANGSSDIHYDAESGLLVFNSVASTGNNNKGIVVIDTKKTTTAADDVLIKKYLLDPSPDDNTTACNYCKVHIDGRDNSIYTFNSAFEVEKFTLGDLSHSSDDKKSLLFPNRRAYQVNYASDHNTFYMESDKGLMAHNLNGAEYKIRYESESIYIGDGEPKNLSIDGELSNQALITEVKYGDSDAVWYDDFSDTSKSTTNDSGGYNCPPSSVSKSNGKLIYKGNSSCNRVYYWVEPGLSSSTYQKGDQMIIKLRVNTSMDSNILYLMEDSWSSSIPTYKTNEWVTLRLTCKDNCNNVGLYFASKTADGWDMVNDNIEIDWVKIVDTDSYWSSWQAPTKISTNNYKLPDTNNKEWLMYRTTTTSGTSNTASGIEDIRLTGYQKSGEVIFPEYTNEKIKYKQVQVVYENASDTNISVFQQNDSLSWVELTKVDGHNYRLLNMVKAKLKVKIESSYGTNTPKINEIRMVP